MANPTCNNKIQVYKSHKGTDEQLKVFAAIALILWGQRKEVSNFKISILKDQEWMGTITKDMFLCEFDTVGVPWDLLDDMNDKHPELIFSLLTSGTKDFNGVWGHAGH